MKRVFVVHETLDKASNPTKNLKPAQKYGELVHLVKPGLQPVNLSDALPHMKKMLVDFTADDFILPVGHPILIGWATAIAAERTGGKLSLLYWRGAPVWDYTIISTDLLKGA